jgi:hypothetical protein
MTSVVPETTVVLPVSVVLEPAPGALVALIKVVEPSKKWTSQPHVSIKGGNEYQKDPTATKPSPNPIGDLKRNPPPPLTVLVRVDRTDGETLGETEEKVVVIGGEVGFACVEVTVKGWASV